jgi:hypothetical protein
LPTTIFRRKKKPPGQLAAFLGQDSLDTTLPFLRQRHRKTKKVKIKMAESVVHSFHTSRRFAAEQARGVFA